MQVSVEAVGNIDRKMTITLPAEQVDKEVDKRLRGLAGRVRIDGFRPGKVPFSLVKKRYEEGVRYEVVEKLIGPTFQNAAAQENLRVAGMPDIELAALEAGKDLQFTATFQVYPEIVLGDVSTVAVTRPVAEVTEADVDKMVDVIRKQNQEWQEVARPAAVGDLVAVDFAGSVDGQPFEGGAAQDYTVELGAGRMLKDFEDGLLGMAAGEEKLIDVAFPEDYHAAALKGKTAQFKLTMKQVKAAVLPEVDAAFVRKFGVESGAEEEFRAEVRKNMQRELEHAIKTQVKQQVMDGLAALHTLDVPKALVADEIRYIRDEFAQNTGTNANELPDSLFAPQAEKRVKLGLLVGEIIRQNNLQRDPARVEALLEQLAASYEDPEAFKDYYRQNRQAMQTIEAAVMEDMIVEWVLAQAKVTEETRDFDSVMNPKKPEQATA